MALNLAKLKLIQLIGNRKISWLCHFTPRENLKNIKENGLKTRDLLSGFENTFTDKSRFDQYRNAICLSISKPNKWMFNRKVEQGFDLCLLLISPEVLYRKNCLFYPHNAATASYQDIDIKQIQGELALEKMFANSVSFQKSQCAPSTIERNTFLENCETTSDQAEVQCLENIEPDFIIHIFEDNVPLTYEDIKNRLKNTSTLYNKEYCFYGDNLSIRLDKKFIFDKNIECVENISGVNENKPKKLLNNLVSCSVGANLTTDISKYKSVINEALDEISNLREKIIIINGIVDEISNLREKVVMTNGIIDDVEYNWSISHAEKLLSSVRELHDDIEHKEILKKVQVINDAIIKYQNKHFKEIELPTISENNPETLSSKRVGNKVNTSRIETSIGDRCLTFVILMIFIIVLSFIVIL